MDYGFTSVARLPSPDDNVGIATQTLESGTRIRYNGQQFQLSHTLLEGHRFARPTHFGNRTTLVVGVTFRFCYTFYLSRRLRVQSEDD